MFYGLNIFYVMTETCLEVILNFNIKKEQSSID